MHIDFSRERNSYTKYFVSCYKWCSSNEQREREEELIYNLWLLIDNKEDMINKRLLIDNK